MNIPSLDPSGELGRLFSMSQPKNVAPSDQRQSNQVESGRTRDDVALSLFAQEVRDLTSKISQQPDIRVDRVEAVRQALEREQPLASVEQVAVAFVRETFLNSLS